jgi:hypothetical protein
VLVLSQVLDPQQCPPQGQLASACQARLLLILWQHLLTPLLPQVSAEHLRAGAGFLVCI